MFKGHFKGKCTLLLYTPLFFSLTEYFYCLLPLHIQLYYLFYSNNIPTVGICAE